MEKAALYIEILSAKIKTKHIPEVDFHAILCHLLYMCLTKLQTKCLTVSVAMEQCIIALYLNLLKYLLNNI